MNTDGSCPSKDTCIDGDKNFTLGSWRDTELRSWLNTSVLNSNPEVKTNTASVIKMGNNIESLSESTVAMVTPVNDYLSITSPVEMSMPVSSSWRDEFFSTKPDGSKFTFNSGCTWYGSRDYDYAGYPYEYWSSKIKGYEDYKSLFTSGSVYNNPWLRSPYPRANDFTHFHYCYGTLSYRRGSEVVPTLSF